MQDCFRLEDKLFITYEHRTDSIVLDKQALKKKKKNTARRSDLLKSYVT